MRYRNGFDLDRAIGLLRKYGNANRTAREMGMGYSSFSKHFRGATGVNVSRYAIMSIEANGRTASIKTSAVCNYLRAYGLSSMEEDNGHLESEICLALGKADDHKEVQKVTGMSMEFGLARKNGAFEIYAIDNSILDVEMATRLLRRCGNISTAAREMGMSQSAFCNKFRKAAGVKVSRYPLLAIESGGRRATLDYLGMKRYLREYNLSSMGEDLGHLGMEVRLALGKAGEQAEKQRIRGRDIAFTFRKTGDGFAITDL